MSAREVPPMPPFPPPGAPPLPSRGVRSDRVPQPPPWPVPAPPVGGTGVFSAPQPRPVAVPVAVPVVSAGPVIAPPPDPALVEAVRARLAAGGHEPTPAAVAAALRAEGRVLGEAALPDLVRALRSEIAGAGPLDVLLRDPEVTDVLVNAPDEVWIDRGAGPQRTAVTFADDAAVRRLAQRLASGVGRRLDDASPYVDATLADGVRLHAVLRPVAVRGTCLSLRVPRRTSLGVADLVRAGSLSPAAAELLCAVVSARAAFLVSGGTGSGKTTLLGALLGCAHPAERLLLAEDSAELTPRHPHVVRLESRPANVEGAGEVTLRDLVRQALRMRPDRLVVGEVRGAEVVELLAALNTGHEGGCGTVHANSAADVPARLEALGALAGLGRGAVHSQVAAALDLVVHVVRERDGLRRAAEVHVLERDTAGWVRPVPAVSFERAGGCRPGPGHGRLAALLAGWWRG
ncbi:TadA family conjugal transfer-associated ATPase [Embleya hyalina]|uniref:Secretion protein n=1 Tax=Embleya hyalina TaxID=516124 RepID=A0A401YRG6_9ACTN|nr:TadA family conjugal transfer-associated ATPase [Embleya hyalina]GCD97198.1 secretion protein [Embleya hyalina]